MVTNCSSSVHLIKLNHNWLPRCYNTEFIKCFSCSCIMDRGDKWYMCNGFCLHLSSAKCCGQVFIMAWSTHFDLWRCWHLHGCVFHGKVVHLLNGSACRETETTGMWRFFIWKVLGEQWSDWWCPGDYDPAAIWISWHIFWGKSLCCLLMSFKI